MWTRILEMSSGYERDFITYLGRCILHDYTNFLDQTAKRVLKLQMGSAGWETGTRFYPTLDFSQWNCKFSLND